MQALILAAGFGSRLGHEMPKALIPWGEGAIIDQQLERLQQAGIDDVTIVVGFQAARVREHVGKNWPNVRFVDNPAYMDTNTAKSMLMGLQTMSADGVVTLNGDVVFDDGVIQAILDDAQTSSLAVDPRVCGEEEIKYRIRDGRLLALNKQVHGEGEAVGINFFCAADRPLLEKALDYVDAQAYFERAVEHMLPYTPRLVRCVDIGQARAMEIDFPEDLAAARSKFGT